MFKNKEKEIASLVKNDFIPLEESKEGSLKGGFGSIILTGEMSVSASNNCKCEGNNCRCDGGKNNCDCPNGGCSVPSKGNNCNCSTPSTSTSTSTSASSFLNLGFSF